MVNILFICSANRFRSVIAAEYLRTLLKEDPRTKDWQVSSAGTWAQNGLPPISQAVKFAQSRGLHIEPVLSREISRELLRAATLVIVMTESQREALDIEFTHVKKRIYLLSEVCEDQVYDIPDPVGEVEESPEELGLEICKLLYNGLDKIKLIVESDF